MESATRTMLRDTQPDPDTESVAVPEPGDAQFGPWALINYQLAALTDAVKAAAYYSAAAVAKTPPAPPKPTPRPGMRPLRRLSRAMAERLARLHPGDNPEEE
jgi:hypothetical protein